MGYVPVIENPRRKRRKMTAKQLKYFGGKKRRSGRKSSGRRRRASAIVTTSNPTRRYRARIHSGGGRRRRSYRNPSGLGGVFGGLGLPGINLKSAAYIGVGMLSTRVVPNLVLKVWPGMPVTGYMSYAVKAASAIVTGMAAKFVLKDNAAVNQIVAGGLGLVMFEIFNNELAPKIGMSTLSGDLAAFDLGGLGEVVNIAPLRPVNTAMGY